MSEYQYYEFAAIDRPLTRQDMAALRSISSRAEITPTRFVNEYQWGDLKADPLVLLVKYFDAFLYWANWGTHRLGLRLPRGGLDLKLASAYCDGESARVWAKGEHVFLQCWSEDESGCDWDDPEPALSVFTPLRHDLASGDYRALYLAWLSGVQEEKWDDDEPEPPVPAGLGELTGPLTALARFLRIDDDLLAAAAERSPALKTLGTPAELKRWITALPEAEKTELLTRQATGGQAGAELWRRFRQSRTSGTAAKPESRTVAELLAGAKRRRETRRQTIDEQCSRDKARQAQEYAAQREQHLKRLAGRGAAIWREIEALIAERKPTAYGQAVELLTDLRELTAREGAMTDWRRRIRALTGRHNRKETFIVRLRKQGLIP